MQELYHQQYLHTAHQVSQNEQGEVCRALESISARTQFTVI